MVGVSLRSSAVRDVLAAQDFVYTTVAMAPAGMEAPQKIEIISDVLVAPEDPWRCWRPWLTRPFVSSP